MISVVVGFVVFVLLTLVCVHGLHYPYEEAENECTPVFFLRDGDDTTQWVLDAKLAKPRSDLAKFSVSQRHIGERSVPAMSTLGDGTKLGAFLLSADGADGETLQFTEGDGVSQAPLMRTCYMAETLAYCAGPTEMSLVKNNVTNVSTLVITMHTPTIHCNPYDFDVFHGEIPMNRIVSHPDRWVFPRLFQYPLRRNGVYLEMGAFDGVAKSNTLFFERYLNWTGVLIEPEPVAAYSLLRSRGRRNICLSIAICSEKEEPSMSFIGGPGLSSAGFVHTMPTFLLETAQNKSSPVFQVPCAPLGRTLRNTGVTYIDLFSLDVEGAELLVLETMDWSVKVCAFLIELDGRNEEKDEKVHKMLIHHGFAFYGEEHVNELWVNPDNCIHLKEEAA